MFDLIHKIDVSKKNMISYMRLSKGYNIKVIMNINIVLNSKACREISQIKHVDHTVYTSHKNCNFDNKISIPSGRAESDTVLC